MLLRFTLATLMPLAYYATGARAQHDHAGHQHQLQAESATTATHAEHEAQAVATEQTVGSHGGSIHQAGDLHIETVIEPIGLHLFAYDRQGEPLDLRAARGLATLQVKGDSKRYRYDLLPDVREDQSAQSITVAVDLSRIGGQPVDLTFQLVGFAGAQRRPATFTTSATVPMTETQRVATAIAAQKFCPVSRQPLGSMGKPIPVTIGDETIYVCCAGCIDAVKANPAKCLAKRPWLRVVPTAEADARFVAAQKFCPVMDEPLDAMGGPYKAVVEGRAVYLCCPGCAKKLHANPQAYLAKLAKQGVNPPVVR